MTYWYPGLAETLGLVRAAFPRALLRAWAAFTPACCPRTRRRSASTLFCPGPCPRPLRRFSRPWGGPAARRLSRICPTPTTCSDLPTARPSSPRARCPQRCIYCGIGLLHPRFTTRPIAHVRTELEWLVGRLGLRDLALYDDAFLADREQALAVLALLAGLVPKARVHTASGFPCRGLDAQMARAMFAAGFATIRLGLETAQAERQRAWGAKATSAEFDAAVEHLLTAGFRREQIGVYLLAGLPNQEAQEVVESLEVVLEKGLVPHLAEYSPVPGSPLFASARATSRYDLDEPIFHNPTLMPCAAPSLGPCEMQALKQRLKTSLRLGLGRLAD